MDKKKLKELKRGRTDEQKKVLDYFLLEEGCMSKKMTDAEYEALVLSKMNSLNLKERALSKLGVDEEQVKEIEPIHFENYYFSSKDLDTKKMSIYKKMGKDHRLRSSAYQITWLFFGDSQVYAYQYTANMDEEGKKERTEEYFYRDITNFSATTESVEYEELTTGGCTGGTKKSYKTMDESRFGIIVPGEKFECSMVQSDYTDKAISGMKAKLREKKF